jgi:glucan biosynthesis protein C
MNRIVNPTTNRLLFFDMVRNLAMLSVVLYHAVAAYSTVTPHWSVHDGSSMFADAIRHLFDVFMMPAFFFVAGYFALPSLTKQGPWEFLKGKFKRIGVPWLLAILIIVPLLQHVIQKKADVGHLLPPFWQYWLTYLKSFGTFQIGPWTVERMSQIHFWFLSLLLTFFIVLVLFHVAGRTRLGPSAGPPFKEPATDKSILKALFVVAVLGSLGYFIVILMTSDMSWITVDLLWQFQPTSLVSYIACFALGCFAYSRQWFAGDEFPRRLLIWVPIGILLTAGFFIIGQDVFAHPLTSNKLAPGLLLAFSFIRTLLCLAFLVIFIAYARKYWNRPSGFNQNLAANSYNIYLSHIFFVTFLQEVLMLWPGGPAVAKAVIVFLAVLPISYGISRLIDRFPRGFVIGFIVLLVVALVGRR